MLKSLPLNQIAISSIDLKRSDQWWREGLGFLPSSSTRLFRGKMLSETSGLPQAAASTRWLVGQDEWLQIELWQYEKPLARLMPSDYSPLHEGFSRCGIWVKNFEDTLERLRQLSSSPLSPPQGEIGHRRVCVRDPDGIFVELFESDLSTESTETYPCNAAFRSMSITTRDLDKSVAFAKSGLGLTQTDNFHTPEHETLWNLDGANCKLATFRSGPMLLEYVQYLTPHVVPKQQDARLNDQGILNIAFGDPQGNQKIPAMREQAIKAGAYPSLTSYIGKYVGAVYMTDPQGFSYEFMGAHPGFAQRFTGFIPIEKTAFTGPDNQRVTSTLSVPFSPQEVFSLLSDCQAFDQLPGLGTVKHLRDGFTETTGIGSERLINGKVHEQISHVDRQQGEIRYRALEGCSLRNYSGEICIKEEAKGSRITWVNRYRSPIPGCGWLINFILKRTFAKILNAVANQLTQQSTIKNQKSKINTRSVSNLRRDSMTEDQKKPGLAFKITKGLILNIVISAAIIAAGHAIFYTFG